MKDGMVAAELRRQLREAQTALFAAQAQARRAQERAELAEAAARRAWHTVRELSPSLRVRSA